ncbi:BTB/POZ domain-containing protein At3g50780 [Punica granatum]|uniref:At3g05675-like ankyrin-like domain-containing protein n=2 Tax=Punica granatum TaxID=22663 RepID=A0A218XJE0_PUNGR|nr:BTB/POZ domain-containing protein At3g50780 [Punica granatum]OWM84581.1 hypothetical protein CDL15_Pgr014151 [Punica granatum]PKI70308.1 hypothetical protein CRG98_009300 [Punica granatum]
MAEIRLTRVEQGQTKIKNVPIAVTPEGFWCCPSPIVFQKNLKAQNPLNKPPRPSSPPHKPILPKKQVPSADRKPLPLRPAPVPDDVRAVAPEILTPSAPPERTPRPKTEHLPRKVSIEFGESGTSNMKVVLMGRQGFCVKLSVHRDVLAENSSFFAGKLFEDRDGSPCLEIDDCEDAEIYVETVGLMYCQDMKQRLVKQSVPRVLRILKVAELLGFNQCIKSCLEYLEAVPWVGEEEEEKVVSSVLRLQGEGIGITPVLKRISSETSNPPKDTLSYIIELVLKSSEERGRREMKSIVLKLLRENSNIPSPHFCHETIYDSCRGCVNSLLGFFRQAVEDLQTADQVAKQITLEVDNISWLLDILTDRRAADEFAAIWAQQQELTALHGKLPIVSRYHVSCVTAKLFVGIGRGQILPSKETRLMLLKVWLQPLIDDYRWLQHGCRSFDQKVVEEGIGRTILTLPLEDQQSILLSWLGSFLKAGDSCPNLQRAFEVWWRRTFIRPYVESQGNFRESDCSMTTK